MDMMRMPPDIREAICASLLIHDESETATVLTTMDREAVDALDRVAKVLVHLIETDEVLFAVAPTRQGRTLDLKRTPLGKNFYQIIRVDYPTILAQFPDHRFNPFVEAFFRLLNARTTLYERVVQHHQQPACVNADDLCEALNELADAMRLFAAGSELRTAINNTRRSAIKNEKSVLRYVERLFEKHARLLVLRVDLSYETPEKLRAKQRSPITRQEVTEHRDRFLRTLQKEALFEHLVGYVWKLEHGACKGFHLHWLFFFNGSKVRQDVSIARLIGEHWKTIADGVGTYWNCNAHKDRYRILGIGMINYDDLSLREGLGLAIRYLTKVDYYVSLKNDQGGRLLGKGTIKEPTGVKRGRPRSDDLERIAPEVSPDSHASIPQNLLDKALYESGTDISKAF